MLDKAFTSDDFFLRVVINDGDYDKEHEPTVTWRIVSNDDLNCIISDDGTFTIGDTLGSVIVEVCVTSENTLTKQLTVNIVVPSNLALFELHSAVSDDKLEFIEGQKFSPTGLVSSVTFINDQNDTFSVFVTDYTYDAESILVPSISDFQISYTYKGIVRQSLVPVVVHPKTLQSIEVSSAPTTVSYIEGQQLNFDGLKIRAKYEYITIEDITGFVVSNADTVLAPSNTGVEIYYTDNGVTKTVFQAITVANRTLQGITIDSEPTKLHYVQGRYFERDGLKVTANYEYMTRDVTDLVVFDVTGRLESTCTEVNFIYTEGDVEKGGKFDITVEKPYQDVRTIKFANRYNATLSWLYEYMSDDGTVSIDDTDFVNNSILRFDQENGIYTVPVGAVVTILKVSPAIVGFNFNGEYIAIEYPSNSYEFEVEFGTADIEIDFVKQIGERITVRFASEEVGQNFAFIYSNTYNGTLSKKDLFQIAQIFEDTAQCYYTFNLGNGLDYTFDELSSVIFNVDTLFIVSKHKRTLTNAININLVYPDATVATILDKTTVASLDVLPKVNRIGYSLGFSLTKGGALLTDIAFTEWLNQLEDNATLYAVYTLSATPVIGSIVGTYA